jgi:hypothetical protein
VEGKRYDVLASAELDGFPGARPSPIRRTYACQRLLGSSVEDKDEVHRSAVAKSLGQRQNLMRLR